MKTWQTSGDLLASRLAGWGEICVVPQEWGGFDVILRIDGSYDSRRDAEGAAEYFREELAAAVARDREAAQ